MATAKKSSLHTSLGMRFFLATMLIVVLAVGGAVAVTSLVGQGIANDAVEEMLVRSQRTLESFQDATFERLDLVAFSFANELNFASYVAETIKTDDVISLYDQLEQRRSGLNFDLAIVVDPEGRVFARSDDPEPPRDDISAESLVSMILDEDYGSVYGTWNTRDELYYAASVPIYPGGILQGILIAGNAIDDDMARQLRAVSGTEVSFVFGTGEATRIAVSTLGEEGKTELGRLVRERPELLEASADEPAAVSLQGRRYLALVLPLSGAQDEKVGSVVSLASLDDQLEPYRRIQRTLLGVGLGAILLALALSYFLKQRVSQPIERLASAAQAAAAGDYDQKITAEGHDEVAQLAGAFDSLLSDLREKRDMEVYVAELARTLPEAEEALPSPEPSQPATSRDLALLGVELRGYSEQVSRAATPREALDVMARGVRLVTQAVSNHGGKLQAVAGHRVVASFPGNRRGERALGAAAEVLGGIENLRRTGTHTIGAVPQQDALTSVVAIVSGTVVSGSIVWESRPSVALAGRPVDELEDLLRVAQPGSLWLSRGAYEIMAATWGASGVAPKEHRNPVNQEPIYAVVEDQVARLKLGELTATQNVTVAFETPPEMHTLSAIGRGSRLGDRFEILSQLGAGGMGVVYLASDLSLNERVALKMLKPAVWNDAEGLDKLKGELKLARKIAHPNVLKTYDFGEIEGVPFISMEYVRGITLRQLLDQSGRLPLTAGLRVARQLCRGLSAAHDQQVMHRDIKPENLIVEHTGNVKLMDFGISQRIQRRSTSSEQGELVGTPFYLAPEQLQGKEADERADLYATGVVLYEIFTGRLPYPVSGNLMKIITTKMNEPPAPPSRYWETIPVDLERIILRCLERNPEHRYGDAETLLAELEVLRS